MNSLPERRESWTIERKITISGIVSIVMLCAALLTVYIKTTERVNAVEIALTYQRGVNDQIREDQKTLKADTGTAITKLEATMARIDGKVDRLLERR